VTFRSPKVTLLVQRIGPYHHARFQAACSGGALTIIEFRVNSQVYAWDEINDSSAYVRTRADTPSQIIEQLERFQPDVLVCVGYADHEIHHAMRWAAEKRVAMVVCSDSTADDEPRAWWKERLKREIVGLFSAGIVAGVRSADYLVSLGLERDRLFTAWDVVDNDYFAEAAGAGQKREPSSPYFLTVARFVRKKNLERLLRAYARYVSAAGDLAWPLVLSGDGELRPELAAQVEAAGLLNRVRFTGFAQYGQLPEHYAGAGAFILPSLSDQWGLVVNEAMASGLPVLVSERCGCAPDLVVDGENGFVFSPTDVSQMSTILSRMANLSAERRDRMGGRSREIISRFNLEAFARGLWQAAEKAVNVRKFPSRRGRAALAALLLGAKFRRR